MSDSNDPRPSRSAGLAEPPAAKGPGLAQGSDLDEARALYAQLDPAWFDEAQDPERWLLEPAVQQMVTQLVEEALEPWRGRLGDEELAALREELELAAFTDPRSFEYLKRLRPRPEQDRSGKVSKGALAAVVGAARASRKSGGGR